jgi:putative flippase GtrA
VVLLRPDLVRKLARYASASVIATATSMTVLGTLVATGALAAGWANVVATGVGTVPSFELNRRWVWRRTGRRSVLREMGPFSALSFAGLALSTLAVSLAAGWATRARLGTMGRTVASEAANVATFATLWVVQYVLLDRVLFRARHALPAAARIDPIEPADDPADRAEDRADVEGHERADLAEAA